MAIEYTCPHCHQTSLVGDEYSGQTGPCRSCGETITIPDVAPAKQAQSPIKGGHAARAEKTQLGGSSVFVILGILFFGGIVVIGGLLALLLPAIQSARSAARRASAANNLKQIALAMHNYHDTYKCFPTNILDEAGKPKRSWRTALLPYLEQGPLARSYNDNVAWDAPENASVRNIVLPLFRSPSFNDPRQTDTNFVAIQDGSASIMEDNVFRKMHDITDGTSNTIIAAEVTGLGIRWAEPRDITINEFIGYLQRDPGGQGGTNVMFADGSVRFISKNIDTQTLRALVTRNGGETIAAEF